MNKSDLVGIVAKGTPHTRAEAEAVIDAFLESIQLCLSYGENVMLSGFGKFEVRPHKPVVRRNPKTGELVDVPAKNAVGFKPSPLLKSRVNEEASNGKD